MLLGTQTSVVKQVSTNVKRLETNEISGALSGNGMQHKNKICVNVGVASILTNYIFI